jgi:hypothetical protein
VDMRAGPMRNDPEFERAVGPINRDLFQGYGRVAILVRTAVGRLQVQRVAKANGNSDPHVFTDEDAALAYLRAREPIALCPIHRLRPDDLRVCCLCAGAGPTRIGGDARSDGGRDRSALERVGAHGASPARG